MEITKEQVEARLAQLKGEKAQVQAEMGKLRNNLVQLQANENAYQGAILDCEHWLEVIEQAGDTPTGRPVNE